MGWVSGWSVGEGGLWYGLCQRYWVALVLLVHPGGQRPGHSLQAAGGAMLLFQAQSPRVAIRVVPPRDARETPPERSVPARASITPAA